jgi:hypothetical protein
MPAIEKIFRDPTPAETAVVDHLLSIDFPGVEALRAQVAGMTVAPDCTCGCGSFTIDTSAEAPLAAGAPPMTPSAFADTGVELFLSVNGGRLTGAEISYLIRDAYPAVGVPDDLSGFRFD